MYQSALNIHSQPHDRAIQSGARRILVVEDDVDLWLAISNLAFPFFPLLEFDFVANVDLARQRIEERIPYDAILADFLLADSDNGYQIRKLWQGESRRFALMSSMPLSMPDLEGSEFLAKPFSGRDLRKLLNRLLEES